MADTASKLPAHRSYWPAGRRAQIAAGLSGIICVLVAINALSYTPAGDGEAALVDHLYKIGAFAAVTAWAIFCVGLRRAGIAAMVVLAFAIMAEVFILGARGWDGETVASANLGIVIAWVSAKFYRFELRHQVHGNAHDAG